MESSDKMVMGDRFTTPTLYDPKVKAKAYEHFLTTSMSLTEIAVDLSVPEKAVALWAKEGRWLDRKRELEMELFRSADEKYRRLIMETRVPTLERHLRISRQIEEMVGQLVEKLERGEDIKGDSTALRRLAETLASATGVSARAAAITDRPFSAEGVGGGGGEGYAGGPRGRVPIVVVGMAPTMPAGTEERHKTVEAEYDELDITDSKA